MNILTFDIEEWFHILDNESTKGQAQWRRYETRIHANTDRLLDLLESSNQRATFFCLGWVAERFPEVIKKIHDSGHEIGSHSYAHQLAYEQTPDQFRDDLKRSISLLEDATGTKIRAYRAPGFSIKPDNTWTFEVLAECGIEIDCSIFPAYRSHGGFNKFGEARPVYLHKDGVRLKEFPINLYRLAGKNIIFSGGGYFRLCPYWLLRHFTKNSGYVMTYFHPRDFDVHQPVITELSALRKFKSYYGLRSAYSKLSRLIHDFDFIDLDTADKQTDWQQARHVTI